MEAIMQPLALFLVVLILGTFICTRYLDSSAVWMPTKPSEKSVLTPERFANYPSESIEKSQSGPITLDIPLNCSYPFWWKVCPANYYPINFAVEEKGQSSTPPPSCPDYFRWIHHDLWPWRETGITREMVMGALDRGTANFRLVVVDGKAYVRNFQKSYQTRDTFTLWGILQLLRRYPGKVPDLDIVFDCADKPIISRETFRPPKYPAPPPIFRYCSNSSMFDIVFPDWSFWGWVETNTKPWDDISNDIRRENKRTPWMERQPYAYWKGSEEAGTARIDLLKCNGSDKQEWNARLYTLDWKKEKKRGYKQSDLAKQCIHRYKIYVEGYAWSVSEKYIMACDSVTLFITPVYYDFFSRGLMPLKHYWPIKIYDKCRSIKHAVEWGNSHPEEAQAIGKAGSSYILDDMKMDYVYDYMFHLLSEYAKLLKYKPTVPNKAVELCSELMACRQKGLTKKLMSESLVKRPALSEPCTMPPPYDPASLHSVIERKNDGIKQVHTWEKEYWQTHNKQM